MYDWVVRFGVRGTFFLVREKLVLVVKIGFSLKKLIGLTDQFQFA